MGPEEKTRPGTVREQSRLRATLSDEPSSGYAFHDASRVETVRGTARGTAALIARVQPIEEMHDAPTKARSAPPAIPEAARRPLSAPPSHARPASGRPPSLRSRAPAGASWPPMPSIPPELEGALEVNDAREGTRERDSIRSRAAEATQAAKVGGAIWEAMPSIIQTEDAANDAALDSTPPRPTVPSAPPRAELPREPAPEPVSELTRMSAEYGDARLLQVEQLVARGAWEQLTQELSSAKELSPALTLLRVIAQREAPASDDKQVARALTSEAISAVASLLGVPENSATALLIGKRLLRRNPGWARSRKPSAAVSVGMLLAGISAGAGIGWLVTTLLL